MFSVLRISVSSSLLLLFAALMFSFCHPAHAQVMLTHNWQSALTLARNILPGTGDAGVPYHLHYDVHFRGPHNSDRTGTYDVYVDPYRFRRTDMASGDFHQTSVEDLQNSAASWRDTTGDMPLGLYDFDSIVREPQPAIFALEHSDPTRPLIVRQQVLQGSPYACVDDGEMARVCLDPFTHVFAVAQLLNQSFVYSDWIPLNWVPTHRRAIPSLIRVYDGSTLLLSAAGKAEEQHTFAPMFFSRISPAEKAPIDLRPVVNFPQLKSVPWYGNVAARITVDAEGKVDHADLVESDNHKVEHPAMKFIHDLRFRPASEVPSAPATFTTMFYLRYLPLADLSLR